MTERLEIERQYRQGFSLLHIIHTSSGAHSAYYPMGRKRKNLVNLLL
jgi:hypothetical protein